MMIWKPPLPRPPQGSRRPSAPRREHPTLFHFTFQRTTLPNSATRSTESIYKEPPPNVKIEKGFFQSKSLALFPAPGIEHHRRPVQGVMPAAEVYPSRPEAIAHYQHPINSIAEHKHPSVRLHTAGNERLDRHPLVVIKVSCWLFSPVHCVQSFCWSDKVSDPVSFSRDVIQMDGLLNGR